MPRGARPRARAACFCPRIGVESRDMTTDRPEHQLLRLSIARRFAPAGDAQVAELLAGPLDWTYVLDAGHRQQILPLLGDCLAAVETGAVPPVSLKVLAQRVALIHARNRQLAR